MKGSESQTICSTLPLGLQTPIVGHKNPPVGRICDTEVDPYLEPVNFFAVHLLLMVLTHLTYDSEVLVYALDTITGSDFCLVAPLLPLWPWRQFQNREKQNHVSVCSDHPPQRSPLR